MGSEVAPGSWSGRRVLITGAGGFIGSHTVEAAVRAGAAVRAFVRYNSRNDYGWLEDIPEDVLADVEIFRGDLVNPEAVLGACEGQECVLHLGALIPIPYSYRHPREFVETNVVGALNVLEAARRSGVERIVHTSSSEVYGTPTTVPIAETHPLQPQSPYAATKVGADQLAESYWLSFGTPVVVVRPFNTFGPRQSARAVIPTIISQALTRDTVELGTTETTRDFLYVEDTVRGVMRCGEVAGIEGEVINLGTGAETSVAEAVRQILALIGHESEVTAAPERMRPPNSEVERLVAATEKAKSLLGWTPEVSFDEGLRRTVEWFRGAVDSYKASIYNV